MTKTRVPRRPPSRLPLTLALVAALGADPAFARPFDWRGELLAAQERLAVPGHLNSGNCARILGGWTERLASLRGQDLAPSPTDFQRIAAEGPQWLSRFFRLRLLLKQRWNEMASPGPACVLAMRRALRYSRFAEDFLAERLRAGGALDGAPAALFAGGAPHTLVNPRLGALRFESGDLLLMRGPHFISSLLARAGDEEGDFSHLAIIGRDEAGEKYVIEALVEKGVVVAPLDDYLRKGKEWRVTLLRFRDRAIADRAGLAIFRRMRGVLSGRETIPYNFALDPTDETRFYCAQVASYAFAHASGGGVAIPEFQTPLARLSQTSLARAFGGGRAALFAPSDVQLDRRFDIAAEFRDPSLLTKTRHANVAMASLLSWLRDGGALEPDASDVLLAGVATTFVLSDGASTETVAALLKAEQIFGRQAETAAALDDQAIARSGYPLSFRELEAQLRARLYKSAE